MTVADRILLLNQSIENKENIADFNCDEEIRASPKPLCHTRRFLVRQFEGPAAVFKERNKVRRSVPKANNNCDELRKRTSKVLNYFGPEAKANAMAKAAKKMNIRLIAPGDDTLMS